MSGSNLSDASFAPAASLPPEPPAPPVSGVAGARKDRHARWKLLFLLLVCVSPVVASYFTYYVVRPEGRRNFGELVEPQRPLPSITATTLDGKPVPLPSLQGQWLLVSVAGGACDKKCEDHLYLQRQLREGLGRDKARLDWVWLVPDNVPVREPLKTAVAQATVLRVNPAQLAQWLPPAPGHELTDHLYVVDAMGDLMMRFPAGVTLPAAAKVRRDLERLMRGSVAWDKPGR